MLSIQLIIIVLFLGIGFLYYELIKTQNNLIQTRRNVYKQIGMLQTQLNILKMLVTEGGEPNGGTSQKEDKECNKEESN